MVYCPWRIENKIEIFCGSHHSNEKNGPYNYGFNKILGNKIDNIICESPAFDLKLQFQNGVLITLHCSSIGMNSDKCFSFSSPKGWFEVGFDGKLKFENRT